MNIIKKFSLLFSMQGENIQNSAALNIMARIDASDHANLMKKRKLKGQRIMCVTRIFVEINV
jgi:hypothetical protein